MPGVNSTSAEGYQFLQKAMSDLERESRTESKRLKDREENKTAHLEESYQEQLKKKDDQLEATVNDIRKTSEEYVKAERNRANNEINAAKTQTYDKLGRYADTEARALRKQMSESDTGFQEAMRRKDLESTDAQTRYEHRIRENYENYQDQIKKAVESERDTAAAAYHDAFENDRRQSQQDLENLRKEYSRLNQENLEDFKRLRQHYDKGSVDQKADFDNRIKQTDEATERAGTLREQAYEHKISRSLDAVNRSHAQETREVRDQLKELLATERERDKKSGEAIAKAVSDYENEWRTREHVQQTAHEEERRQLRNAGEDLEKAQARIRFDALMKKDLEFTEALQKQNLENHAVVKDLRESFLRDRDMAQVRVKRDRESQERAEEARVAEVVRQSENLFHNQAKAYQKTHQDAETRNKTEIAYLEEKLRKQSGYEDPTAVSPAAEEAIRRTVMSQYQKLAEEKEKQTNRKLDSVSQEYAQRFRDQADEKASTEQKIRNEYVTQMNADRNQFNEYMREADYNKQNTINTKQQEHDRQNETSEKGHARSMDALKRQFEDQMEAQRYEFANRLNAVRSEDEHRWKMSQREYSAKYSQQARSYEKQLSEQKEDYEFQLEQAKVQADKKLREAEKVNKAMIDELSRNHSQRLAQSEALHKERERLIAESYETELEKTKRTNIQLVQQKRS